jgi:hypothetical protein
MFVFGNEVWKMWLYGSWKQLVIEADMPMDGF